MSAATLNDAGQQNETEMEMKLVAFLKKRHPELAGFLHRGGYFHGARRQANDAYSPKPQSDGRDLAPGNYHLDKAPEGHYAAATNVAPDVMAVVRYAEEAGLNLQNEDGSANEQNWTKAMAAVKRGRRYGPTAPERGNGPCDELRFSSIRYLHESCKAPAGLNRFSPCSNLWCTVCPKGQRPLAPITVTEADLKRHSRWMELRHRHGG